MSATFDLNLELLQQLREKMGRSFFLFNAQLFEQNLDTFKSAFQQHYNNVELGYSYKTNYLPAACKIAKEKGAFAEVVSGMEYDLALKVGCQGQYIIFNGPMKEEQELYKAFENNSIVHFDSYEEIKVLKAYLKNNPKKQVRCALRCNFDIGEKNRSRFGFDASEVEEVYKELFSLNGCKPIGIHCHFSTRHRSLKSYKIRTQKLIELAKKVFKNHRLEYVDIGGSFFGEMPEKVKRLFDTEVPSFADYGMTVGTLMKKHFPDEKVALFLEPGVAVVANTMRFVCQVYSIKKIADNPVVTLTGGAHNVRPTGSSGTNPFKVIHQSGDLTDLQKAVIGGYTCMETDIISQSYTGKLGVGDFLIFDNMGAYNIVFKPPFIKGSPPIAELSSPSDEPRIIKNEETMDDIFLTYKF